MIQEKERFDTLIVEAERQPFTGWDFSYLVDRSRENDVSWDYREKVLESGLVVRSHRFYIEAAKE